MNYKKGIMIGLLCVFVFSLGGCDFWDGFKGGFSTKRGTDSQTEKNHAKDFRVIFDLI
ncbi:hypothetical protein [Bacillus toyonensis]|uniref:hypothetical protein n=1 Tax=Bacillus toyonensis TaxID=155322 RepID=UPI0021D36257|nr:hypothetical protein [Bacillus toyonensis]MCU4771235.1 hypothetical protein [Bacillus toyonensis]